MQESGDYYIRAEVLLPRGDHMARGHVVARTQDTNGNTVSRLNSNPILDTRAYQVEFAAGEISELNGLHHSRINVCPTCFRRTLVLTHKWNDTIISWEELSELKESHLVQMAECTFALGINHTPAFNWWKKNELQK